MAKFITVLQTVFRQHERGAEYTKAKIKGKRVLLPAEQVERVYRKLHKKRVRVSYDGPDKRPCSGCGTPFLFVSEGRGRHPAYCSNACKQWAYRQRRGT